METKEESVVAKFKIEVHSQITADANGISNQLFTDSQLGLVVIANVLQDKRQLDSKVHFDNCCFIDGSEYIKEEWQNLEADDPHAETALGTFGRLLHTVQDFYAHSNWVELHQNESPIPIWNLDVSTLPNGIVSGTWVVGFPKRCPDGAPAHAQLNKDDPNSDEGKIIVSSGPNAGKSLFILAYEAALSASLVQFERYRFLLEKKG